MVLLPIQEGNLVGNIQNGIATVSSIVRTAPAGTVVIEGLALYERSLCQTHIAGSGCSVFATAEHQLTVNDERRTIHTLVVTDAGIVLYIELAFIKDTGIGRAREMVDAG